ncbi:hypothetical protein F4809DRAFT_584507 [Biscogniauxia mediterranea]|nr:hypothetical protein F4809DRAFT_584507 [Biscogniauxia mediterranea]
MKTTLFQAAALVLATAVSTVYADTTTADSSSGTSVCAAQNILETCLVTTEGYVSLCSTTDYSCLCDKYTGIMTCFNNCPDDSRAPSYQNQKDLYCMNASLYATTTAAAASSTQTGNGTSSTGTAAGTGTGAAASATATGGSGSGNGGSGSSRTAAATATSTDSAAAAGHQLVPGFAAAVAGVAAVLL